jgi:hypothetical protein
MSLKPDMRLDRIMRLLEPLGKLVQDPDQGGVWSLYSRNYGKVQPGTIYLNPVRDEWHGHKKCGIGVPAGETKRLRAIVAKLRRHGYKPKAWQAPKNLRVVWIEGPLPKAEYSPVRLTYGVDAVVSGYGDKTRLVDLPAGQRRLGRGQRQVPATLRLESPRFSPGA